jgi:hypothetical protein
MYLTLSEHHNDAAAQQWKEEKLYFKAFLILHGIMW